MDTDTAFAIAKELEKKIKYSGKVNDDNTITLTISKNDWDTFSNIKKSIENNTQNQTVEPVQDMQPIEVKSNTRDNELYNKLSNLFPNFMQDDCTYSKYSADNFQPLSLEKISSNQISIAHYYEQNGDLMRDPEIVFNVDYTNKTLTPIEYYNDSLGSVDLAETEQGINKTFQKDLTSFSSTWFDNIENQGYKLERSLMLHEFENTIYDVYVNYKDNEITSINCDEQVQQDFITKNKITIKPIEVIEPVKNPLDNETISQMIKDLKEYNLIEFRTPQKDNSIIENGRNNYKNTENIEKIKYNEETQEYVVIADLVKGGKTLEDTVLFNLKNIENVVTEIDNMLSKGYEYLPQEPINIIEEPTQVETTEPKPTKSVEDLQVGDTIKHQNKVWTITSINGDFSINMENTNINDNNSHKSFYGNWRETLKIDGFEYIPPEDVTITEKFVEEPTSIENIEQQNDTLIEVSKEELNEVAYSLQQKGSFDFISSNNEVKSIKYNENSDSYFMVNNQDNSITNFGNNFTKVRNEIKNLLSQGYGYEGKEPVQNQKVIKEEPITEKNPTFEVKEDTPIAESVHKSKKKSTTKKSSDRKSNKKLTPSELYEKFYKVADTKPIEIIQDEVLTGDKITYHSNAKIVENTSTLDRYNNNINAIKTLRQIEKEHRYATPQEQEILSKYAGWGGVAQAFDTTQSNNAWRERSIQLKKFLTDDEYKSSIQSTNTSFYTSPEIVNSMYKALKNFGFEGGNVLEPSMATGNFFSNMPKSIMDNSQLYGVEIDDISGRIAKQLYPDANIKITGFENTTYSNNSFDVALGNIPFGNFSVSDQEYNKNNFLIHDYFFAKAIDKVKPTGVVAFVTSSGTMDKENDSVRKYIAERCDLIGAIRLPNNAFDNAGTSVTSDIIFLQKRDVLTTIEPDWIKTSSFKGDISINNYFTENPDMVLGKLNVVSGRFGNQLTVEPNKDIPLSEQLEKAIQNLHLPTPMKQSIEVDTQNQTKGKVIPANPNVKNFTYTQIGNDIYYRSNEIMVQQNLKGKTLEKVIGLNSIRNAMNNLLEAQERNCSDEELKVLEENLNTIYDNYTNRLGTSINSRGSKSAFKNDVDYNTICALESYFGKDSKNNPIYTKSDIFTKRTIKPTLDISITKIHDTLQMSLNNKGCVNIPYMTDLAQKHLDENYTADRIVDELSEC